jgi:2-succinyl-5-enolpyruvyl-6-hydroxy-3-cyclohexene-1-carboxylate synthase
MSALANLAAARALVDTLTALGVRHAVLAPGSRSTPLVLALERASRAGKVVVHTILDERSAAFFALGLARAQGVPSLLVATSGSAGAHFAPAVIEASESGVPLVLITADRPPELQHVGAPQTTPQDQLFGSHTRWQATLPVPEAAVSSGVYTTFAARAYERATAPKAGPVHLDAPYREPLWSAEAEAELDRRPPTRPPLALYAGARRLDEAALARLASELGQAERGLIVAGPITERDTPVALRALAEHLGWPLVADAASNARAEGSPAVITRADAIVRSALPALTPDLVIKVGRAPSSRALHEWLGHVAADKVLLLDGGGDVVDHGHLARALVAADVADTAARLQAALPRRAGGPWLRAWQLAEQHAARVLDAPAPQLWEGAVAHTVARHLPPHALVHLGSGMPVRDFDGCSGSYPAGVRVLSSRGVNGIDGAASTAAGLWEAAAASAAARGERPPVLVALIGDLTALHDVAGLRLLAGRRVVLVVVDNGGGGIFEFLPIAQHARAFERHFLTPQPDDLLAVARALGLDVAEATDASALGAALAVALESPRPTVLRVPVDRRANVDTHRARWAEVGRALEAALSPTDIEETRHEHHLVQGA